MLKNILPITKNKRHLNDRLFRTLIDLEYKYNE